MKLFFRGGKEKRQEGQGPATTPQCPHPITHQVALREDASAPTKITGLRCSQCGERLKVA